jgi:hypothetical protein
MDASSDTPSHTTRHHTAVWRPDPRKFRRPRPEESRRPFEVALLYLLDVPAAYARTIVYLDAYCTSDRAAVVQADKWVKQAPHAWRNTHLVRPTAPHGYAVTDVVTGRKLPIRWDVPVADTDLPWDLTCEPGTGRPVGFLTDPETDRLRLSSASRLYRLLLKTESSGSEPVCAVPVMSRVPAVWTDLRDHDAGPTPPRLHVVGGPHAQRTGADGRRQALAMPARS